MCDTTAFTRIKRLRDAAWSEAINGGDLCVLSDTGLLEITRRAIRDNNLAVFNAAASAIAAHIRQRQGCDNGQPVANEPEPEPAPVVCISAENPAPVALVLDAVSPDSFVKEVSELLARGLSGADIARQWNIEGRRTKKGAEFTGANILRDFRKRSDTK